MNNAWVVFIGLVVLFWLITLPRRRDQREFDQWWRDYQGRERRRKLQTAWSIKFRRRDDETEDEYLARFEKHVRTVLDEEDEEHRA